ncbi:MAG: SusC/RagA family TonB-linked outer membrane protein [Prevotellaceae bacterium]|nr:SusC/RagA family TonB-linked outer membrane protein [Prevotellaceae bacterium]
MIPAGLFAQTEGRITVRGTVSDNAGPLLGVTVSIQGTTNATTTDADGNYSITVTGENATLSFSYIGYKTYTERVGNRNIINVTLEEEVARLDEVVVIGYGTQRREAVTGSVVSMGNEGIREVPAANVTQALQGRFAGVEMSQTSTKPGATMQIRIRGTRSLNASNDPLVVLDGIPFAGTLADINPVDIRSVDILKDASATAIYGSRGANGVILVTTFRSGQQGTKPMVSYNGYVGAKTLFARFPMMDGPEFVQLRKVANRYPNTTDESDNINTDWQDLFYRTGIVTNHDLSVMGGTLKGSYNFGMGYYKEEALVPTQNFERISLRGSFDQEIGKLFRFGVTTNNSYNISNGNQIGMYGILEKSPISSPYNSDGSVKRIVKGPSDDMFVWTREVLEGLYEDDKYINQSKGFGSYNNLYGEVKIPFIEGLKFRANLGLNIRMSTGGAYTGEGVGSTTPTTPSTASINNSFTTNWAIETMLMYEHTFAEKHQVNFVGLHSAEQSHYHSSYAAARDIPYDAFQFYNLGQAAGEITINPAYQGYNESALESWMARLIYSYDGRYLLSASIRSDGSSRLAPGYKWHTYPAISVGWNIREESFMESVSFIDKLKLRIGYGETSNQAVDPYATLGLLSTRPYNFGPTGYETGFYVSNLPNSELGWEYSNTWNFGVDFTIMKNRLTGTIEYYVQNTHDLLMQQDLPRTSGVSGRYWKNIGETQNKGVEFSLNGVILDNLNGWTWEAGVNFYANRNKIIALSSEQKRDEGNSWFVGYPIDVIYDYEKIGIWQVGDPYLNILEPNNDAAPGMIKVRYTGDYDATGAPTRAIGQSTGADDRVIQSIEPNFQGGFNTRVAYKGFDLNIVGAFKNGGKLISTIHGSSGYLNMLTGRRGQVKVDYWTEDNTDAKYPKPGGIMSLDNPKYGSTLALFDASYLKVRAITLGYNFSFKNIIDRMRVYFTVQNPFVLFSPYTNETGMDPETNSYGGENQAVSSYQARLLVIGTNSPSTRNYLFGINLTF